MKKILLIIISLIFIGSIGCTSFKPIVIPGWTDECNVMATMAKLEESDKEKKLASLAMPICFKSIKRRDCQAEIYGIDPVNKKINSVNYDDPKLYRNYTQCMAEKD